MKIYHSVKVCQSLHNIILVIQGPFFALIWREIKEIHLRATESISVAAELLMCQSLIWMHNHTEYPKPFFILSIQTGIKHELPFSSQPVPA